MNFKVVKKGIVITAFACATLFPVGQVIATDGISIAGITLTEKKREIDSNGLVNAIAEIQKQEHTEKTLKIASTEEINFQTMVSSKVFVEISDDSKVVMESADENSAWVGKVYRDSAVKIVERGPIWSKIKSGNVEGYVKTEDLITGKDAVSHLKAILEEVYPEIDVFILTKEEIDAATSEGETKAEEEARIAAEEAARAAEEASRIAAAKEASRQKGAEVVNYGKNFIGNPYVYGGTSLTKGADCSGFVMSVYRHFGVSLPRNSYAMRSVGKSVSYKDMQPGDIVCYEGHVGIYAGNGKLLNAVDTKRGIKMTNVTYKKIVAIRRIF